MKFFYCPSCNSEYSFVEEEVERVLVANEVLRCKEEQTPLVELTAKELGDRQAARFKAATEEAKIMSEVKPASKVKFSNEGGVAFVEIDGRKLRVTGNLRVTTEIGEVQISL